MNKGLEALKRLTRTLDLDGSVHRQLIIEDKEVIEKELKDYELCEEVLNSYGLNLTNFREACLLLAMLKGEGRNIHDINKQLKALEIISEKRVQVGGLLYGSCLEGYNKGREIAYQLSQEEYNLLKEVLL